MLDGPIYEILVRGTPRSRWPGAFPGMTAADLAPPDGARYSGKSILSLD
jgi:hypothetical protein